MNKITITSSARFIILVCSPLIVPSISFLLLMTIIPGVENYSFRLKTVIMGIVVLSSCLIPLFYLLLSDLNHKILKQERNKSSGLLFKLFSCISIFLGAQFLARIPVLGDFRIILLGLCLILIISILVSFKWNMSEHLLVLGSILGAVISLNFRYGVNILWMAVGVCIISGLVGSSLVYTQKNTPAGVYSGFLTGACIMFSILLLF